MGLIVLGMGLFLLLTGRDRKLGAVLAAAGAGWFVLMIAFVIPAFGSGAYPQSGYFEGWGSSFPDIILAIASHPIEAIRVMFDGASLVALGQALLPAAMVLPFLGAEYLLIPAPQLAVMLLSTTPEMHALQRWYLAPIIPILYAAVAIGLTRLPGRRATWGAALLLAASLFAYRQYSPAPLGKMFAGHLYDVTDRDRAGWRLLDLIPAEASVSAQVAFTTQLAQREQIGLFEAPADAMAADYTVLAEGLNAYPIPAHELHWEIVNVLAQPSIVIEAEVDGIYLLRPHGPPNPALPVERVFGEAMLLEKIEIAATDEEGFYRPTGDASLTVKPGSRLRVSLFWQALAKIGGERTISLRLSDPAGNILAQVDSQPAEGSRPTSWWEPGWYFREVRYLLIPEGASGALPRWISSSMSRSLATASPLTTERQRYSWLS